MDKQTLSGYGWIVIVTLILAVLLALATPFGTYVGDGVTTVVNGFINTNAETLSDDSVESLSNKWEQKFENGVNNTIPTVYELKKQYDFTYYSTLEDAISAVNSGVATVDVVDEDNAEAGIYVDENGRVNVVLLKNIETNTTIKIIKGICLNLGGKSLSIDLQGTTMMGLRNDSADLMTIDGRLKGSAININAENEATQIAGIMTWSNAKTELLGLTINMDTKMEEKGVYNIYIQPNGSLMVNNCIINMNATNSSYVYGIQSDKNALTTVLNSDIKINAYENLMQSADTVLAISGMNLNITNTKIIVDAMNYTNVRGINTVSESTLNVDGCDINVYTNYGYDASNTLIGRGFAIYCLANNAKIYNSNFYSPYIGIQIRNNAQIKNVNIETFSGNAISIYGDELTVFMENINAKETDFKENKLFGYDIPIGDVKYVYMIQLGSDSSYGNNFYMNNCILEFKSYDDAIRVYGNNNEYASNLYISNSTIRNEKNISITNDLNRLYIGQGNNFTKDVVNKPECVVETNEIYTKPE